MIILRIYMFIALVIISFLVGYSIGRRKNKKRI